MSHAARQLATAVASNLASQIQAGAVPGVTATPTFRMRPVFDLTKGELDTMQISVVPAGGTREPSDRTRLQREWQIDVAVQQRFPKGTDATLADALDKAAAIFELTIGMRLTVDGRMFAWTGDQNDPLYDTGHWDEKRVLTTVNRLTFLELR